MALQLGFSVTTMRSFHIRSFILALCASSCTTAISVKRARTDSPTCNTLEATTDIKIDYRYELDYTKENNEYWYASVSRTSPETHFLLLSPTQCSMACISPGPLAAQL